MRQKNESDESGFTLIELMITVAIIAVLAAVALPAYTDHLKRGKRSAAASFMRTLANKEEQQLLNTRCYFNYPTDAACTPPSGIVVPSEVSTNYTVTVAATNTAGSPPSYTITATRTSANSDTKCGNLTLDNLGTKGVSGGTSTDSDYCWK